MTLSQILQKENKTIIDVREPFEFQMSHVPGAINMPMGTITSRISEIRLMPGPIIVYCASGNRSNMAMRLLLSMDVMDVYDGGSRKNVLTSLSPSLTH